MCPNMGIAISIAVASRVGKLKETVGSFGLGTLSGMSGGGVPACLDVHESQLTQDVGDQSGPVRGAGGQQPAVQHHSSLTIGSPDRMDEGAAQSAQHLSLDSRVSRPPGLGSRAAQRLYPGVNRARVQGS